jgi:hypothetical protein
MCGSTDHLKRDCEKTLKLTAKKKGRELRLIIEQLERDDLKRDYEKTLKLMAKKAARELRHLIEQLEKL